MAGFSQKLRTPSLHRGQSLKEIKRQEERKKLSEAYVISQNKHNKELKYRVAISKCVTLSEKLLECENTWLKNSGEAEIPEYYDENDPNGTNADDQKNNDERLPPFNLNFLPKNINGGDIAENDKIKRVKQIKTLQT